MMKSSKLAAACLLVATVALAACAPQTAQDNAPATSIAASTPTAATTSTSATTATTEPSAEDSPPLEFRGWPDTAKNAAGVYSWDGSRCAGQFCNVGFMHNGYGSGDVDIIISLGPTGNITGGAATAVIVGGHDGIHQQISALREKWYVDIDGTSILILLSAEPGTSRADLAEAHAIIDSIRTEPTDNRLGFRLIFTLSTNDWDSG
jgi:hypothetical protein